MLIKSEKNIKKYEEIWGKIRNLIRSITKISDDYDEKYMKIKFKDTLKAYFANVLGCSRLRLWVGYFVYFKFTRVSPIANQ